MDTFETIRKRCSLRAHMSDRPVEPDKINRILEAACLAPSARNSQPWRFIVVQGKEAVGALAQTAFLGPATAVGHAPVLIVVCARPGDDVTHDGKEYYLLTTGSSSLRHWRTRSRVLTTRLPQIGWASAPERTWKKWLIWNDGESL